MPLILVKYQDFHYYESVPSCFLYVSYTVLLSCITKAQLGLHVWSTCQFSVAIGKFHLNQTKTTKQLFLENWETTSMSWWPGMERSMRMPSILMPTFKERFIFISTSAFCQCYFPQIAFKHSLIKPIERILLRACPNLFIFLLIFFSLSQMVNDNNCKHKNCKYHSQSV